MGQVERIFGIFLLIVLLFAGVYAAMASGLMGGLLSGGNNGGGGGTATVSTSASGGSLLSMAPEEAMCSCYDDAFKLAASADASSPGYSAGFQACRAALGIEGGAAWTAGWEARQSGARLGGCRQYLKAINY